MIKRFLALYVLLCVLPFLILGLIAASITEEAVTTELIQAASLGLEESAGSVRSLTAQARELSLSIAGDAALQEQLGRFFSASGPQARQDALTLLDARLQQLGRQTLEMSCQLCLLCDEAAPSASPRVLVYPEKDAPPWALQALSAPRLFSWALSQDTDSPMIRQAKAVYSTDTWQPLAAVLCIRIPPERLRTISPGTGYVSGRLYIADAHGELLYPYYNYDGVPASLLTASTGTYDVGKSHALVRHLTDPAWTLVRIVDPAGIRAKSESRRRVIMLSALFFTGLSMLAAVYITLRVTRPIVRLSAQMKSVQAGQLLPIQSTPAPHEIRTLYESYNSMTQALNTQIEENYVSRLREREAELKALQAQINPHFLYNTLDSINWMALRQSAQDISRMVVALSDMLRFSLNKGHNRIAVRDELRQVESYLYLQRIRYSESFSYEIEADAGVRSRTMIKMLLQPIVENAILHGFDGLEGGHIWIRVFEEGSELRIEVANDGHPVDPVAMNARIRESQPSEHRGYGIVNVLERIHGHYGPDYGLTYLLRDGLTVAQIRLPLEEQGC